jgi:hypothetical protein
MCSFIYDEPRWISDEHQHSDEEHNNILMFILETQQHFDGQNVHLEFQAKVCGGPGHVA